MIALLVSLAALAALGWRLRGPFATSDASRATAAVRGTLAAFAILVVTEAALGFTGQLGPWKVALVLVGTAALVLARRRDVHPPAEPRPPLSRLDGVLLSALAGAFLLLIWTGLHRTDFPFDSLSYHLHAPATWMHEGRLVIVPAVFGDTTPAYAPSNLELWFLFLLSPLRSDYLAGAGQLPVAVLAVASVVAAVREAGGGRAPALAAGLAFILIAEVWDQAPTAMVDLGMTAFLLASLPFARRVEVPALATALGLALGSKYVAVVLVLPFAAFALTFAAATARQRPGSLSWRQLAQAAAILLATGGFWYVRNALVTGNPLFPGAFPGLALPALYDSGAMRRFEYHIPVTHLKMLASMLAGSGVGFATAMCIAFVRRARSAEVAVAVALIALPWFLIPYQGSRFLFPAFGVAAVAIGLGASAPPALLGWGPLAGAVLGALIQGTMAERLVVLAAAAVGAGAFGSASKFLRRLRWALATAAAAAVAVASVAGYAGYESRAPPYGVEAWSWFRAHVRQSRIAYTGMNLAFPLAGERVANQVVYVNVAGAPGDRLHDFARRLGALRGSNPEPVIYREGASFATWWRNLRAAGTQVLFVAKLGRIMRGSIAADPEGFPVERRWADEHPDLFSLRFASSFARVYAIAVAP